jgi:N-acetylglucosamine-6-phosphate deacetylase
VSDRLLTGCRIVTPGAVRERGWIAVRDGVVAALGNGPAPPFGPPAEDLGGRWVVPGFVDPHCHGAAGHSVYTGDPGDVRAAAAGHLAHGTTTMLASIATTALDTMLAAARAVRAVIEDGSAPNVAGIHFEGPFLSPARRGAQTPGALLEPDAEVLESLLEAAGGHAVTMTVAPELPGALDLIERYARRIRFCLGHTDATGEVFRAAVDRGARVATHLFNAMPPLHHRDPGPVAAALLDGRVTCELIADGHHLAPDAIRLAHRLAGPRRLAFVSDAMPAAGLADGRYAYVDREVVVADGAAFLAGTTTLAGSASFLAGAFRQAVAGLGLDPADAARMCATTAAGLLGLDDRGAVRPGLRADLVVLDEDLTPRVVLLAGTPVTGPPRTPTSGH